MVWLWHDFKLQQQNMWCRVTWSVLVTWPDLTRKILFCQNMCNECVNKVKVSARWLQPYCGDIRKTLGWVFSSPPPGIGLRLERSVGALKRSLAISDNLRKGYFINLGSDFREGCKCGALPHPPGQDAPDPGAKSIPENFDLFDSES